jgi:protocatechuate 3,4-dioxygenase beta subunit
MIDNLLENVKFKIEKNIFLEINISDSNGEKIKEAVFEIKRIS